MKNFTYLILTGLFSLAGLVAVAQFPANPGQRTALRIDAISPRRSCPTFELVEKALQADPAARQRYFNVQQQLQQLQQQYQQNRNNPQYRIQAITSVPVVVHVLLPAAQQALVTDAVIQSQIDTLNFYYGGSPFNSDSLRVYTPFRTTYGRSEIRFCMAQRTPADLPTNGITRTVTATIYNGTNVPGSVIDWDPTKYLNIWVVNAGTSGLLGYSYTPGSWGPSDPHQGFVNDYRAFGAGPGTSAGGYMYDEYNQGKTAVHEIGHYFNLAHTWGPNNTGNPSCTLSDGCADTPPTSAPFFGCPSSVPVLDPCSPSAPGIMWQNHMDYANDACMVLFTNDQCTRMTAALTAPDRIGLLTSNGCVPPPAAAGNDARISAIITPANGSTLGCSSVVPVATIQNVGTNTLTSATINVRLDGGAPVTAAWTGSLTQGQTANVTLASLSIVAAGSHTIKIHTTLPNASTDANPANDTATSIITKVAPSPLPVVNGFETTLLPTGWTINNPNSPTLLWIRFNPTVAAGGTFAAAIDNYGVDGGGTYDDLVTPVINTTSLLANDSLQISFDLAFKNYPDPINYDSLKVLVTNNCGATWTTIWERGGPGLATAGSSDQQYIPASIADWKNQKVSIGNNIFGAGQVQVAFRNVGLFGNIIWLDNINIDMKPRKDMQATAILRPNATECTPPFVPSLTVRNAGGETVTAFKTGYILNNGTPFIQVHNITLAVGASTTVTFPSLNPPAGINTIKLFVADPITPSIGPDGTPSNDTLVRTFSVPPTVTNIIQGFEGTTFIPVNWSLINANANVTWERRTPGKGSDYSAFIDNYNNNTVNQLDLMQSPPVNTVGADGVTITFDVAHKDYPGSLDRLRVLVSTNCGVSFTSVYSKSGPTLATAGDSDEDFTNPLQNEWRTETINLNNTFTGGNLIVQFENRNDFGNNIFIDNINIVPVFKRDIEVLSVSPTVLCTAAFTPVATIRNRGTETITGYSISYAIGAGAPVTTVVTGASIAPGATANVTLTAGTLVAGANSVKVYSFAPVTASGTGDQYLLNDTIVRTASVAGSVTAPTNIVETFEGTTFAPAGWIIANPDNALTWQKAGTGKNSLSSAFIRNFVYYANGQRDALYTPVLNYTGVDSIMLTFDLSATTKDLPADAPLGLDTLEVLVTKDCGNTFTSVYKKWGDQLQTIGNSSFPQSTEFNPGTHPFLWRTETINLTSYASGGPLQVVFRNITNNQNDVYIDNVNFRTVVLPPRLKSDGVIVTPNPSTGQFNLWFVQTPTDLSYVTVLTSAGQLVWNKVYNGTAPSNILNVNLGNVAAGVYLLNLGYTDKSKDKQIKIIVSH